MITFLPSLSVEPVPASLSCGPFDSAAGFGHAEDPVRGVINSPVLRLRPWNALLPFAALVPLRVYPSESVPSKDLCMAETGSGVRPNRTGMQAQAQRTEREGMFLQSKKYRFSQHKCIRKPV